MTGCGRRSGKRGERIPLNRRESSPAGLISITSRAYTKKKYNPTPGALSCRIWRFSCSPWAHTSSKATTVQGNSTGAWREWVRLPCEGWMSWQQGSLGCLSIALKLFAHPIPQEWLKRGDTRKMHEGTCVPEIWDPKLDVKLVTEKSSPFTGKCVEGARGLMRKRGWDFFLFSASFLLLPKLHWTWISPWTKSIRWTWYGGVEKAGKWRRCINSLNSLCQMLLAYL